MLSKTGQVTGAVPIDGTFRPASSCIRISNVRRDTGASGHSSILCALSVLSTRRRVARVFRYHSDLTTSNESISLKPKYAAAEWCVIYDIAFSVFTATIDARIQAFFPYTSLILRTLLTDNAFRSAVRRASNVICNTRANGSSFFHLTDGVRATWRWYTGVLWRRCRTWQRRIAVAERVSVLAWRATTYRIVVYNITQSIYSASSWTWIDALLTNASSGLSTF